MLANVQPCPADPSLFGIKRVHKLVQRVCLTLEYSDPGRVLSLLRSLFENSSDILQIKINRYLTEVTESDASFMIMAFHRKNEYRVTVVGQKILPLEYCIDPESTMIEQILTDSDNDNVINLPLNCLDSNLKSLIIEYLLDTEKYKDILLTLSDILVIPIVHPINEKILFYNVLVNPIASVNYKRIKGGLVLECMRFCAGIVINSFSFEVEKLEHDRARNFIEFMRKILINIENTSQVFDQISLCVCDLMNAKRCFIFLRDECGDFVTKITEYGEAIDLAKEPMSNIRLPSDFGLAGIVAQTGEIINCIDAQNDPRYCEDIDIKYGFKTETVLCLPLRRSTEIVGVIEVYNKEHSKKTHVFTDEDVATAEALEIMLPPLIFHSLNVKKIKENLDRRILTDSYYIKQDMPTNSDVDEVLSCAIIHGFESMMNLSFSQYTLEDPHLGCIVYDIFNKFGLIRRFDIRPAVLVRFTLYIFQNHPQFPFHNWQHTIGTFHFAAVLINELNLVANGYCTHIEVLALLIAALCHSVDYRGAISLFQVSSGMTLAALYSSPTHINKQFQNSQVFRLLHNPSTNILENISGEHFEIFSTLLKKLINVSDIGHYMSKQEDISISLGKPLEREDLQQRISCLSLFMVCSVLNDYAKDFDHCKTTGEITYQEFMPDVDTTLAQGIFDLTQFNQNIELIPELQIHFISTICIPTFRLLSELFPVTYPCLQFCEENVTSWQAFKEKLAEMAMEADQGEDQD